MPGFLIKQGVVQTFYIKGQGNPHRATPANCAAEAREYSWGTGDADVPLGSRGRLGIDTKSRENALSDQLSILGAAATFENRRKIPVARHVPISVCCRVIGRVSTSRSIPHPATFGLASG